MKIVLLVVGKTTDAKLDKFIDEYANRVNHYVPFEIKIVPDLKSTKNLSFEQIKKKEAELIQKQFLPGDYLVLLDEHGKERRSVEFAQWMEKKMSSGPKRLIFCIGGPYGFAPEIHKAAQEEISLSLMTFSHQLIRLLFVEQVYRAMTILNGEPYHHE